MREQLNSYQVAARYGVSASTIVRWRYLNYLPKPKREGRRLFWELETLKGWEAELAARHQSESEKVQ